LIRHFLAATAAAAAADGRNRTSRRSSPCRPQLDPNDSVDTLRAALEAETGLRADQQRLLPNGRDVAAGCAQ